MDDPTDKTPKKEPDVKGYGEDAKRRGIIEEKFTGVLETEYLEGGVRRLDRRERLTK